MSREAFEKWWNDPSTSRRLTDMSDGRAYYIWRAALESHSAQPQVPEGYALVPIEPTASMLFYASTINRPHDLCREIYRDMIAGHTHPKSVLTASQEQENNNG